MRTSVKSRYPELPQGTFNSVITCSKKRFWIYQVFFFSFGDTCVHHCTHTQTRTQAHTQTHKIKLSERVWVCVFVLTVNFLKLTFKNSKNVLYFVSWEQFLCAPYPSIAINGTYAWCMGWWVPTCWHHARDLPTNRREAPHEFFVYLTCWQGYKKVDPSSIVICQSIGS